MKFPILYTLERLWVALALAVTLMVFVVLLAPVLVSVGARKALVAIWAAAQPYLPIAKERAKVAALVATYPAAWSFFLVVRGVPAALAAIVEATKSDFEHLSEKWQGLHLSL